MASVTPRASGLWSDSRSMSYDDDDDLEALIGEGIDGYDARSPLDRTIDRIGMVSDSRIGVFSSSMFGGMMFGAVGWGTCSDLLGRTTAFNATLFLTSVFGVLSSFAPSFPVLCIALFFLGSAVGGSMPTDGTLLMEHMPNGKQYLVTALSVFFSFGAVLAAVVGLLVIPGHSCPPAPEACDVASQNMGWKYLLIILGLITLSMFIARMVFFRLHESPRYLVHAGRPQEAVESLQLISKFNGSELSLGLDDVAIHVSPPPEEAATTTNVDNTLPREGIHAPLLTNADMSVNGLVSSTTGSGSPTENDSPERTRTLTGQSSRDGLRNNSPDNEPKDYSATGKSDLPFEPLPPPPSETPLTPSRRSSFYSIASTSSASAASPSAEFLPVAKDVEVPAARRRPLSSAHATGSGRDYQRRLSTASSFHEVRSKLYWKLPRWFRKPLYAWLDRVAMVLSPEWMKTTLLVWAVWCSMSLAYTMFNVYLPKLLEGRLGRDNAPKTLNDSLWDVVIYSFGGCPGAILGAYMVDTPLGRRGSLASSTLVTALFCLLFVFAQHPLAVTASTVGISLSATTMWAVLYGWTPEIFGTRVRGTACGIASALSRIGGMIAPMLGGTLLMIDPSFPVYASITIFIVAAICVLLLDEDSGEGGGGGERVIVH
ncbi:hypothetical protein EUX98_g5071 [Antrodiella citrinella]|uniref:Major facilitator superfamily (MFS) profile domain-containing protein n=1 Tax=Antrodiella citrinella TaxID=2447956 RepID=A0A4S4MU99_9APHY|nr:hypothetical protein EUX98_g5071 [Antrodiella citrinella]